MEVQLNTLYVMTRRAVIRRNHLTLQVLLEGKTKLTVPIHQLESVAVFGGVHVTPSAMALCAEHGAAVAFLSESGRLVCRVDAPSGGNVLLRREQYRQADRPEFRAIIARNMVAGKIQNSRNLLLRSARESEDEEDRSRLVSGAKRLAEDLPPLERATDVDSIRGLEGDSAKEYFGVFTHMVKRHRETFRMAGRSRRPPLDPLNALLSFFVWLADSRLHGSVRGRGLGSVGGVFARR